MRGYNYEHIINVSFLQRLKPDEAKKEHIRISKEMLQVVLGMERDSPPDFSIITDGNLAFSESQVKPYGTISYLFIRTNQVGKLAIQTARDLSPVASGRYKRSWILIADGEIVNENNINNKVNELILVNFQPYARKIHVRGARIRHVPPGIVEKVRQVVQRRFKKSIVTNIKFIELPNISELKVGNRHKFRSGRSREQLTYPALVITRNY